MWGTQEPASWKFLLAYRNLQIKLFKIIIYHRKLNQKVSYFPSLSYNVYHPLYTVFVLGRDKGYTAKYNPLPEGTPEGKGLYLTVYPKSSPNKDIV